MIMNKSHAIVWIRQDFRISKNHALSYATNNHDLVSAIYIYNSDDFKDLWSLIVRFVELALRMSKGDGNISANTGFTGHLRSAVKRTRIALGKLKNNAAGWN